MDLEALVIDTCAVFLLRKLFMEQQNKVTFIWLPNSLLNYGATLKLDRWTLKVAVFRMTKSF